MVFSLLECLGMPQLIWYDIITSKKKTSNTHTTVLSASSLILKLSIFYLVWQWETQGLKLPPTKNRLQKLSKTSSVCFEGPDASQAPSSDPYNNSLLLVVTGLTGSQLWLFNNCFSMIIWDELVLRATVLTWPQLWSVGFLFVIMKLPVNSCLVSLTLC